MQGLGGASPNQSKVYTFGSKQNQKHIKMAKGKICS